MTPELSYESKDKSAKPTGRASEQEIVRRQTIRRDIPRALACDELCPYLQPQYSREGTVTGAEILMRWNHPVLGLVMPGEFIPIMRETGQLKTLARRVIEIACEILDTLQARGEHYPISVNVSPETLREADFVDWLIGVIDRETQCKGHLTIEITEEVPIRDLSIAAGVLHRLADHGVRFSIDDFGAGYSSVRCLKALPIHELKLDKILIEDTPEDPTSAAIVESVVALAKRLGLRVVAEGVETQAQSDFLFAQRCDAIQGYLAARPLPAKQWLGG